LQQDGVLQVSSYEFSAYLAPEAPAAGAQLCVMADLSSGARLALSGQLLMLQGDRPI
jgi:hypothetical protein